MGLTFNYITILENKDFGFRVVTVGKTERENILKLFRTLGEVRERLDDDIPYNITMQPKEHIELPREMTQNEAEEWVKHATDIPLVEQD